VYISGNIKNNEKHAEKRLLKEWASKRVKN
jgi:hypothetical protein